MVKNSDFVSIIPNKSALKNSIMLPVLDVIIKVNASFSVITPACV